MTTMKVFDGTSWKVASLPAGTNATTYVGPEAPPGPFKIGDLWYDTDDVSTLVLPMSIANGGTGATSAANARTAFSVPAIGDSTVTAGPPTSGTFARGDQWLDSNTVLWLCTTGGTPGTWQAKNVGEELAYNQTTSSTTITQAQANANLVVEGTTRTYDGSPIIVEVYSGLLQMPANNAIMLNIWDGGTDLGMICEFWNNPTATAVTVYGRRRLVPTAGSHNYRLAAWVNGGSGIVYAGTAAGASQPPTFIRVTRA